MAEHAPCRRSLSRRCRKLRSRYTVVFSRCESRRDGRFRFHRPGALRSPSPPSVREVLAIDARTSRFPVVDTLVHLAGIASSRAPRKVPMQSMSGSPRAWRSPPRPAESSLVFLSSIKVHGEGSPAPVRETSPVVPADAYATSRRALRTPCAPSRACGLRCCGRHSFTAHGSKGFSFSLMKVIARGVPLPFGSVANRRSFIYVGNLTHAVLRCLGAEARFWSATAKRCRPRGWCSETPLADRRGFLPFPSRCYRPSCGARWESTTHCSAARSTGAHRTPSWMALRKPCAGIGLAKNLVMAGSNSGPHCRSRRLDSSRILLQLLTRLALDEPNERSLHDRLVHRARGIGRGGVRWIGRGFGRRLASRLVSRSFPSSTMCIACRRSPVGAHRRGGVARLVPAEPDAPAGNGAAHRCGGLDDQPLQLHGWRRRPCRRHGRDRIRCLRACAAWWGDSAAMAAACVALAAASAPFS